jgi:hypothetical protein
MTMSKSCKGNYACAPQKLERSPRALLNQLLALAPLVDPVNAAVRAGMYSPWVAKLPALRLPKGCQGCQAGHVRFPGAFNSKTSGADVSS